MLPRQISKLGWIRDSLDYRDVALTVPAPSPEVQLPLACDLRSFHMPPVYNQLSLGSCVSNATAAAIDYERSKQEAGLMYPSRLFIYYNTRALEGTVSEDSGCQIRDAIKVIASQGVCPESEFPYLEDQFATRPPDKDYVDALLNKTLKYSRVTQNEYHIKHCLAVLFQPVIFGFSVFAALQSDEVAKTGILPMPGPNEAPEGGHAVLCCGYNSADNTYLIRNSWGKEWGQSGYFVMPGSYLLDPGLCSDFWTICLQEV